MKVEVKIDDSCKEPKVIVVTDELTDEVNLLLKRISNDTPQVITGFHGEAVTILDQEDIIRIYAENGKVFADMENGGYCIRLRLYELEERLDRNRFVRISNSEIINLKNVKGFDLSFSGTICVTLSNGIKTYVSRRYVQKIKQILGI